MVCIDVSVCPRTVLTPPLLLWGPMCRRWKQRSQCSVISPEQDEMETLSQQVQAYRSNAGIVLAYIGELELHDYLQKPSIGS